MPRQRSCDEEYQKARERVRRWPTFLLRRRERAIVARRPAPSEHELAELAAIRKELAARSGR